MMKGRVVDLQSKEPLPNANIVLHHKNKGWTCDADGNFVIYVSKNDTLKISSLGFINKILPVRSIDSSQYYTLEIALMRDFVQLKDVTVYPFNSKYEFEQAFINYRDPNKITLPGVAPPKYSHKKPKSTVLNPVSFLYDMFRKKKKEVPKLTGTEPAAPVPVDVEE